MSRKLSYCGYVAVSELRKVKTEAQSCRLTSWQLIWVYHDSTEPLSEGLILVVWFQFVFLSYYLNQTETLIPFVKNRNVLCLLEGLEKYTVVCYKTRSRESTDPGSTKYLCGVV